MAETGCKTISFSIFYFRLFNYSHYRVQAENLGGRNSCLALISVLVPKAYKGPEFIEALRAVLTGKNETYRLCNELF